MITLLEGNLSDLTIVLAIGLSAGTIVSALAWPLIARMDHERVNNRNQIGVFAGVVLIAVGLLTLAAAPRLDQLNTIPTPTWENAGFTYLFAVGWILPMLFGRAVGAESWATLGRKWRRCLKYLCLATLPAIVLIVLVQGPNIASILALVLVLAGAAAVWRAT